MANVFATRTGVWSATATWNTSALPTVNDDVFSNNFTVYVDNSYRVLTVRNSAGTGINSGGFFVLNNGVSLSALVFGGAAGVYCVQALSAAPSTCTLVGNLCADSPSVSHPCVFRNSGSGTATVIGSLLRSRTSGINMSLPFILNSSSGILNLSGNYPGAATNGVRGIFNTSTGTINIVGSLSGLVATSTANALENQSSGTVNITGDIYGFNDVSNGAFGLVNSSIGTVNIIGNIYGPGVSNSSTGTVNITGNSFGNTPTNSHGTSNTNFGTINLVGNCFGFNGSSSFGIRNSGSGRVVVIGNVQGGNGSGARGASNEGTGFMQVQGIAVGNDWGLGSAGIGGAAPGIFGSQTGTTIVQSICCGSRGQWPTEGNVFILPANNSTATFETSAFQDVVLFTSLSANITPPASSVRFGTKYNLNDYTGTCIIPSISSVQEGVAVDNTFGIACVQPQQIWNVPMSAIDTNTLGGRLKESATIQSFGQLLTAFDK